MKKSMIVLAFLALSSVNSFAGQIFSQVESGGYIASSHGAQKALGACYLAQYESCTLLSNNITSYDIYGNPNQYEAIVDGENRVTDNTVNRIINSGTFSGDCGQALANADAAAQYRCSVIDGMPNCSKVMDVTISDNGADFCQSYSIFRGSDY